MSELASISVAIECDQCSHYQRYPALADGSLTCPQCDHEHGKIPATWTTADDCPLCGCRHLYRRKDFNQLVGLALIVAGAGLGIAISYWFLLLFTLLDLALYRWVAEVAVCHRCEAEYRGAAGIDDLPLFTHHTAEIYQTNGSSAL